MNYEMNLKCEKILAIMKVLDLYSIAVILSSEYKLVHYIRERQEIATRNKIRLSYILFFLILTFLTLPILTKTGTHAQAAVTQGLKEKELLLYVGGTYTLKLQGIKGTAKWSSSDKSIAEVSAKGKVKAKKKGTATITATVGSKKYKCKVTVDKVSLNYNEVTLNKEKTLTLSIVDSKKKVVAASNNVKWTSSDSKIASVDAKGIVYPKEVGTATITGTMSDGTKASCKINVPGIRFLNQQEQLKDGESLKLEYIYIPPDGKKSDLIWTIEYDLGEEEEDPCGELPLIPYSFDQKSATLTALRSARLIDVMVESKSDPDICRSYLIEFVGVHICNIQDRNDHEYSDIDYNDDYEDDLWAVDDEDPIGWDPVDYEYLARYSKPTLRTSERFIIDKDCSITIYDAPKLYLPAENWDIWEKFYYTLDGTTPTMNSTRFSSKIYLEQDCTLKMVGVSGNIVSEVLTVNIKVLSDFYLFWGSSSGVDNATVMYAIRNNVSDLSVLDEKELELYYKAKQILAEIITPGMTDYDKLKAIHDYICINVTHGYGRMIRMLTEPLY